MWTQQEAIDLCRRLEAVAPYCGAHIGLTGGCLYKDGERKDLDIVVYRIRQSDRIDRDTFFSMLETIDIHVDQDHGFVVKAHMKLRYNYLTKPIDFLFPEAGEEGGYRYGG